MITWIGSNFWEVIAALLSLWCVWLATKNKILNWPISMLASIAYAYVFYQNRFFSETYLQGIFLVFQAYGWWFWSALNPNKQEKQIAHLPKHQIIPIALSVITAYFLWLYVYISINPTARLPYLDAFLTVLSITALWMQARRWVENWYLWIVADLFYIPMFFWGKQYITAVLYLVFIVLARSGLNHWRRSLIN